MAAALGLAAYSCASIGAGQESTSVPHTLEEGATQLELTWPGGSIREYCVRAGRIAEGLPAQEQVAADAAAVKLLSSLLSIKTESFAVQEGDLEVDAADLSAMAKLARFLLTKDNVSTGQR
jgi:hypothetical protein